jgi:BNR repeat-like domain
MVKYLAGMVAVVVFGVVISRLGAADQSTTRGASTQGGNRSQATGLKGEEPIEITGEEQHKLIAKLPDGGLPPVVGVQNFQVFRASRDVPEMTDGKGWTYNHHMDIANWAGRLYVAWTNGEKDEDIWPAREVYSTSTDGVNWSSPSELFPMGVSTSLRAYFFHAPNGKMLVFAGLRVSEEKLDEATKGGLVVREIRADHSLGEVFKLIEAPSGKTIASSSTEPSPQPSPARLSSPQAGVPGEGEKLRVALKFYKTSEDAKFVEACEQLLADRPVLEQQDYGVLLGDRRMKWHDVAVGNRWMKSFGKAFSFFHRKDGDLVGIAKSGWTVVSSDEGETWSEPVHPKTLVTNLAKVAAQRTADGRYALVYNPKVKDRFPLAIVTGDDGETFGDMRIVHGEVPRQRYQGENKNLGAQYVRSIAEWARDGSWKDNAMWIVYSSNKEDIWVSRIPLPVKGAEVNPVADRFEDFAVGGIVPGWNTYSPKWAKVGVVDLLDGQGKALQLEDGDPYDYARAQRVFVESAKVSVEFEVEMAELNRGGLEIELCSAFGGKRPVRIVLEKEGMIRCAMAEGKEKELGAFGAGKWVAMRIDADAGTQKYSVVLDGKMVASDFPFVEGATSLARISFRTGEYRGVGTLEPVEGGTDRPSDPARFLIRRVSVQ